MALVFKKLQNIVGVAKIRGSVVFAARPWITLTNVINLAGAKERSVLGTKTHAKFKHAISHTE